MVLGRLGVSSCGEHHGHAQQETVRGEFRKAQGVGIRHDSLGLIGLPAGQDCPLPWPPTPVSAERPANRAQDPCIAVGTKGRDALWALPPHRARDHGRTTLRWREGRHRPASYGPHPKVPVTGTATLMVFTSSWPPRTPVAGYRATILKVIRRVRFRDDIEVTEPRHTVRPAHLFTPIPVSLRMAG